MSSCLAEDIMSFGWLGWGGGEHSVVYMTHTTSIVGSFRMMKLESIWEGAEGSKSISYCEPGKMLNILVSSHLIKYCPAPKNK
jgi:hypothetical protein